MAPQFLIKNLRVKNSGNDFLNHSSLSLPLFLSLAMSFNVANLTLHEKRWCRHKLWCWKFIGEKWERGEERENKGRREREDFYLFLVLGWLSPNMTDTFMVYLIYGAKWRSLGCCGEHGDYIEFKEDLMLKRVERKKSTLQIAPNFNIDP